MTVKRWCESGKLPALAKPYGTKTTYLISPQALEMLEHQLEAPILAKAKPLSGKPHSEMLPLWKAAMAGGTIKGRVFSPATIETYSFYVDSFIKTSRTLSKESLQAALLKIPAQHFAKRLKVYESLVCFGRFLSQQGCLPLTFAEEVQFLRPQRHLPAKRITVDEVALPKLFDACTTSQERLILTLLAHTGLRASEACALRWADINLEQALLIVQCGKGGKMRRVGLTSQLKAGLEQWKASQEDGKRKAKAVSSHGRLLTDNRGKPMTRHGIFQRVQRLGELAGVPASPHALRRAFVTINANKGRPLQMLQMACGHADIQTTRAYCMTKEQEVIDAMKEWD